MKRWPELGLLALLIAVTGGVTIGAAAGARYANEIVNCPCVNLFDAEDGRVDEGG